MNVFLAIQGVTRVGDVPIIDSFAAGIKMCESLTDLKKNSGVTITRKGYTMQNHPKKLS